MDRSCLVQGNSLLEKGGPSLSERRYPFGENRKPNRSKISAPFLSLPVRSFRSMLFNDRVIARDENVMGRNCAKTENNESI